MEDSKYNPLSKEERYIIDDKGTEQPFTGEYDDFYETGTYICRRCNAELYRSKSGSRTRHHAFAHGRPRTAIRPTARAVVPQRTPIGSIARNRQCHHLGRQ